MKRGMDIIRALQDKVKEMETAEGTIVCFVVVSKERFAIGTEGHDTTRVITLGDVLAGIGILSHHIVETSILPGDVLKC
jgi:hypothetical protein